MLSAHHTGNCCLLLLHHPDLINMKSWSHFEDNHATPPSRLCPRPPLLSPRSIIRSTFRSASVETLRPLFPSDPAISSAIVMPSPLSPHLLANPPSLDGVLSRSVPTHTHAPPLHVAPPCSQLRTKLEAAAAAAAQHCLLFCPLQSTVTGSPAH